MKLTIQFHNGNPALCRIPELKIKPMPECEGGGWYMSREQAGLIVGAVNHPALDVSHLPQPMLDDIKAHIMGAKAGDGTYEYELGSGWRCFHCGEMFRTIGGAELHFGKPQSRPACNDALAKTGGAS